MAPRKLKPSRAKEEQEQEQSKNGSLCALGLAVDETREGDKHAKRLTGRTDEEHLATAETLDRKIGTERRERVDGHL
jgi:hypothetical protein